MFIYRKLDWPQNKLLLIRNYQSHRLQDLRTINTSNNYGSGNKWGQSKSFWAGLTIDVLLPLWRQCKTDCFFLSTKGTSICWSLVVHYQTWPRFVYTNLQIPKFIPSRSKMKTCLRNFEKMFMVVLLSFLHAQHLLMKLLFQSWQTYSNQLLGLMLANYIHSWYVNPPCLPVFIRVEISIQRQKDSHLDKARPVSLKVWPRPFFNAQDQIAKARASIQQADRKKINASVLMVFVLFATLCSKQWAAFITLVPFKRLVRLSLRRSFNVVVNREKSMNWEKAVNKRKLSLSLKCGSLDGGECTRQAKMSEKIIRQNFPYRRSIAADQLIEEKKRKYTVVRSGWHCCTQKTQSWFC